MKTFDPDRDARAREAREWAAQERARRQASGAPAASPDPDDEGGSFSRESFRTTEAPPTTPHLSADASYQRIAEALRRPPSVDLPAGFAARVARLADAQATTPATAASIEPAFERGLVRALVATFALCAVAAGAVYGTRVLTQLQAAIGTEGLQWTALLAACLGASWAFDWLRRRVGHDDAMHTA